MKHRRVYALAAFILAAALLTTGCTLYDSSAGSDISRFVDPTSNPDSDYLPEGNFVPSEQLLVDPLEVSSAEDDPTNGDLSTIGVEAGTLHFDDPAIDGEYYMGSYPGEGFRFYVPFAWREAMQLDVTTEFAGEYTLVTYEFFYVSPTGGGTACMLTLKIVPQRYFYSYGMSNATRVASEEIDGVTMEYYIIRDTESLPSDFTDVEAYIDIYGVMAEQDEPIELISALDD